MADFLQIRTLGGLSIRHDGDIVDGFASRKAEVLLVYLACNPRVHRREVLAELLWDDRTQRRALGNLRVVLSSLRKQTGAFVTITRDTAAVNAERVWLDAAELEAGLAHDVTAQTADAMAEAFDLYRGDFLAGVHIGDARGFEEWLVVERERLHRLVLGGHRRLGDYYRENGRFRAGIAQATRLLELDPLLEAGHRQLMALLAQSGQPAAAVAQYETCCRLLDEELGMAPSRRTTEMYRQIMAGELAVDAGESRRARGYELREEIGAGAYGTIYRAIQPAIGREVAVKVIRRQYADDPDFIRRFEAEAQTVARLEHPYIVPLYDYWRDPDGAYLVMRLLRGGDLRAALKDGPWEMERAAQLVEQVTSALAAAHRQGIVHRDIKPGNILFDDVGNAYLSDFGIARDLGQKEPLTGEERMVGTPDYSSPEQLRAEPVTAHSDLYSLGAILYEMLTGERPFAADPLALRIQKQLQEPLPSVRSSRPEVPGQVDEVIQRATAKRPSDRYPDALALAQDFHRALSGSAAMFQPPGIRLLPPETEVTNPYKGLRAFQESDASEFFGRDALVQQLVGRLADSRFLAVVGPSGSGKSSLVKAGLIPALRREAIPGSDKWFVAEMLPGSHPLEELELALLPIAVDPPASLLEPLQKDERGLLRTVRRILPDEEGAELLLVIDQFEELFTATAAEHRQQFLDSLLTALAAERTPLRVVVTLRADFYDRPLQMPPLAALFKEQAEIVLPLNREELTRAIVEPARQSGVRVEEALVTEMVADVAGQPGALPLLQYALTELFEESEGNGMTLAAYRDLGGVSGALARRADELFADLDEETQNLTRQLFLRLVTLGEGVEDTRRRVLRSELEGMQGADREKTDAVLDAFGRYRLLTFDHDPLTRAPTVEVAHEALLREWPRLRHWLDQSRDDIRLQRRLAASAAEWNRSERDDGFLLRGSRLDLFGDWAADINVALTHTEHEFLDASMKARRERDAAEEARRQQEMATVRKLATTEQKRAEEQARAALRLQRRALFLAGLLVAAAALAITALFFANQSNLNAAAAAAEANQRATAQAVAEEQTRLTKSRELALAALNSLGIDPERSILLALHALESAYTKEAEEALHRGLQASRTITTLAGHEAGVYAVAYSPDGSRVATASRDDGAVMIWEADSGRLLYTLSYEGPLQFIYIKLLIDALGSKVVLLGLDADRENIVLVHWDLSSGEPMAQLGLPIADGFAEMALGPDTTTVAIGYEDGTTALWDMTTGERRLTLSGHNEPVWTATFSPDGSRLMTASLDGTVNVWDVPASLAAGQGEAVVSLTTQNPNPSAASFDVAGTRLLIGFGNGAIQLWDLLDSEQPQLSFAPHSTVYGVAFSPDETLFASFSQDGTVTVWDTSSGEQMFTLSGHTEPLRGVAFSPDGTRLVTGSTDGTARIWNARPTAGGELLSFSVDRDADIMDLELSPDEEQLAIGNRFGPAMIRDARTGQHLLTLAGDPDTGVYRISYHPDGSRVATAGEDNVIRVWDTATGDLILAITGHGEGESGGLFLGTIDVAYSPDGSRLATAGTDGIAKVWDAESGAELLVLVGHTDGLHSLTYSPDGSLIATSSDFEDTSVRVWDAETGAEIYRLTGHPNRVLGLAFSPDNRHLATAGARGVVKMWDMSTGDEIYTLPGQVDTVRSVAFTPDGGQFITGGDAIRLWDAGSGAELYTLWESSAVIQLSADGQRLYAGHTSEVHVFNLSLPATVDLAKSRVTRSLTTGECQRYLHVEACPEPTVRE